MGMQGHFYFHKNEVKKIVKANGAASSNTWRGKFSIPGYGI